MVSSWLPRKSNRRSKPLPKTFSFTAPCLSFSIKRAACEVPSTATNPIFRRKSEQQSSNCSRSIAHEFGRPSCRQCLFKRSQHAVFDGRLSVHSPKAAGRPSQLHDRRLRDV